MKEMVNRHWTSLLGVLFVMAAFVSLSACIECCFPVS